MDVQIDEYVHLKAYVEVYVWIVAVPRFCSERGGGYASFLETYAERHIN